MKRKPILSKEKNPLQHSSPPDENVVSFPTFKAELSGRLLDLKELQELPDGRLVVEALVDWQGRKRGGYTVGLDVRRYLRHVISTGEDLGRASLTSYRSALDADKSLADSTRQSYYSNAAAFVAYLAKTRIIQDEPLPCGFRNVRKTPKRTFAEAADNWQRVKSSELFAGWLSAVAHLPKLDSTAREVLAVSKGWMELLEDLATQAVQKQVADWAFADAAVARFASKVPSDLWRDQRSVECAIALLHATHGNILPGSCDWPSGVGDYLRKQGWSIDRVRAALFPTVKSLDAFLVLALANPDLAPNVDSVLFYAFSGCVAPTEESSKFRVVLRKFRGGGPSALLERSHPLVEGLKALDRVVSRSIGPDSPGYRELVVDGGLSLFVHFLTKKAAARVKVLDPSMGAYMVRRFIKAASREHPVLAPLVGGVTGENFRTTHLLIRSLRGESIFAIQEAAKHSSPELTLGYLNRVEVEASSRVRHRNYQDFLISQARASRAKRLGNGFHCEPINPDQAQCLRLDSCTVGEWGCSARKVVLESPRIIAEWIAWEAHIYRRSGYLKEHRPERWAAVWGPRLAEYRVLLESVSASAIAEAEKFVAEVALLPVE